MRMLSKQFLFAIDGRTNRRDYLKFLLLHIAFIAVAALLLISLTASSKPAASTTAETATHLVCFIICLSVLAVLGVASISVHIRRLHDMNLSAWALLIGLVPPLLPLVCLIAPGTKGGNRYGPPTDLERTGSSSANQTAQHGS